jgi:hypothetical protein
MQSIEPVLWPMAEDGLAGALSFCPRRLSAPGAAIQAFHAEFPPCRAYAKFRWAPVWTASRLATRNGLRKEDRGGLGPCRMAEPSLDSLLERLAGLRTFDPLLHCPIPGVFVCRIEARR